MPSSKLIVRGSQERLDRDGYFRVGVRESAQSWRELLVDIKARDPKVPPEIAVGDGSMK